MFELSDSDTEAYNDDIFKFESSNINVQQKGIISFGNDAINSPVKRPRIECQSIISSPSYSPVITSTQKSQKIERNSLFNTKSIQSPIKMQPGISSEIKRIQENLEVNGKFPGPAGKLPKLKNDQNLSNLRLHDVLPPKNNIQVESNNNQDEERLSGNSQSTQSKLNCEFIQSDNWVFIKSLIGPECWVKFQLYSLDKVINMARCSSLPNNKIPICCLKIDEIEFLLADAAFTMSDSTNSIKCAVHRHVLQQYKDHIRIGSVFIMQKVSIFSPTGKQFYLNITPANIINIVSSASQTPRCQLITSQQIDQLIQTCSLNTSNNPSNVDKELDEFLLAFNDDDF